MIDVQADVPGTSWSPVPTRPAPRSPRSGTRARRAGLDVTRRTSGTIGHLSPIADLAAYRVAQEALANAVEHGPGTAEVLVHHEPREVDVEVRDPVPGPPEAARAGGQLRGASRHPRTPR